MTASRCLCIGGGALLVAAALAIPMARAQSQAQGQAHVHGVATLDIAVDGSRISLLLVSPLDNLLGFEHEPGNDAEQMRAKAAINKLRDGAALFRFDARARCTLIHVAPDTPLLKLGSAAAEASGHGSLVGSYAFDCADAGQATAIEVGLFPPFSRMQRIEVQAATAQGQFKRTLERPEGHLELMR